MISILMDAALRSLVVAAAVGLLLSVLRPRSAAFRHTCWTGVLFALATMPLLSAVLPSLQWPLLPASGAGGASVGVAIGQAVVVEQAPLLSFGSLALLAYMSVALAFVTYRLAGYYLGTRLVRSAVPVENMRLSKTGRIRVLESAHVSVPVTFGSIRPAILLPPSFRQWESNKLQSVLNHEYAHVARNDFALSILSSITKAVFWFHPLAWWLEWRLSSLAEQSADDIAARHDPTRYAESLVELAHGMGGGRLHGLAVVRPRGLATRVERLLNPRYEKMTKAPNRITISMTFGLIALVSLLSAALVIAEERPGAVEPVEVAGRTAQGPFTPGNGVTEPRLVDRVDPDFPDEAREAGVTEGMVILECIVQADGSVDIEGVVRGAGYGFDQAAIEALRQWRFEPGTLNGEPVDVRINFEVNFRQREDNEPQAPPPATEVVPQEPPDVTPPTVLERVQPLYPQAAREAAVSGVVVLRTIVRSDGTAEIAGVVSAPEEFGELFSESAITAVSQWRYDPATRNGEPVDVEINVNINYSLR